MEINRTTVGKNKKPLHFTVMLAERGKKGKKVPVEAESHLEGGPSHGTPLPTASANDTDWQRYASVLCMTDDLLHMRKHAFI